MKHVKFNVRVTAFILFMTFFSSAQQEEEPRLSLSFGVGYFGFLSSGGVYGDYGNVSFANEPDKQTQINLSGDVALRLDEYIFSFYLGFGLVDPIPYKQANYSEFNITAGKELISNKGFVLEGHFGIGYFQTKEEYSSGTIETWGNVGFPFRIKANFYLSKHFAIGINPNANFNLGQNSSILSVNLISQIIF
ncbi:hypothetical protein [Aestuariivivens insulae]|uniref:hypothetical protein n=1 Tax=Aestuariivivens insulae TaxID=1621988 RepID=UPI001F55C06A|nr:hypothetical protein [Aestuariivivens insulae]